MYALKSHPRMPVNFSRIPDHLCAEIFCKQSGVTLLRSKQLCQWTNEITETVLTPPLRFISSIFIKHGQHDPYNGFFYIKRPHMPLNEMLLCCGVEIGKAKRLVEIDPELNKELLQLNQIVGRPIPFEGLWSEQNRRGPRGFHLSQIPENIRNAVLAKASLVAVVRLARSSTAAKGFVDDYFNSTELTALVKHIAAKICPIELFDSVEQTKRYGQSSIKTIHSFLEYLAHEYSKKHAGSQLLDEEERKMVPCPRTMTKEEICAEKEAAWQKYGYSYYKYIDFGFC